MRVSLTCLAAVLYTLLGWAPGITEAAGASIDTRLQPLIGHGAAVSALLFLRQAGLVASGSEDSSIIVWDCHSGDIVRRLGVKGRVSWFHQEADGLLWVGSRGRFGPLPPVAFDVDTGREVPEAKHPVFSKELEIDDRYRGRHRPLAHSEDAGDRKVWQKLAPLVIDDQTSYAIQDDGHVLLGFGDGRVELWDANVPILLTVLRSRAAVVHGVACSGDGGCLATWEYAFGREQTGFHSEADLRIWDLHSMRLQRVPIKGAYGVISACMTARGDRLFVMLFDHARSTFQLLEIDPRSALVVRKIGKEHEIGATLRLSADDQMLMINETTGLDKKATLWTWDTGDSSGNFHKVLNNLPQTRGMFMPRNHSLLAGRWERPFICDLNGNKLVRLEEQQVVFGNAQVRSVSDLNKSLVTGFIADVDCHPGGEWIAYGTTHRGLGGFQVLNLNSMVRWGGSVDGLHHVRFRPGHAQVLVAGSQVVKSIHSFDLVTGRELAAWEEDQGEADRGYGGGNNGWMSLKESLALTADGNRAFMALTDGTVRMLALDEAGHFTNAMHLLAVDNDDWCAAQPDGHYAASPGGLRAMRLLRGGASLALAQVDVRLNRPDLVAQAAGAPASAVAALNELWQRRAAKLGLDPKSAEPADETRPKMRLTNASAWPQATDNEAITLQLVATASKNPLGRVQVLVNGVPWPAKKGFPAAEGQSTLPLDTSVPLAHGLNRLQVSAFDNSGVESLRQMLTVTRTGTPRRGVHMLAVGVSKYASAALNLEYPDADARAVAASIAAQADEGADRQVKLVLNEQATSTGIRAAGKMFQQSQPDDLAVIFMAGHGMMRPVRGVPTYFFCPHDLRVDHLEESALSFEDITTLFDGIPARHRLLLLDTCHAGEMDEADLAQARQIASARGIKLRAAGSTSTAASTIKDRDRLAIQDMFADFRSDTGAAVLAACGGAEVSVESDDWHHGAFTLALLEALEKGAGDMDQDGRYTCADLQRHLASRVVELTGGIQRPAARGLNPDGDFTFKLTRPPEPFDPGPIVIGFLRDLAYGDGQFSAIGSAAARLDDRVDLDGVQGSYASTLARLKLRISSRKKFAVSLKSGWQVSHPAPDAYAVTFTGQIDDGIFSRSGEPVNHTENCECGFLWRTGGWKISKIRLGLDHPIGEPPPVGPALNSNATVESAVVTFVTGFIAAGQSGSGIKQIPFYADHMDRYFDDRQVNVGFVQRDLTAYNAKWPQRSMVIQGQPSVRKVSPNQWQVTLRVQFQVANAQGPRSGTLTDHLIVRLQGGRLTITSIWSGD